MAHHPLSHQYAFSYKILSKHTHTYTDTHELCWCIYADCLVGARSRCRRRVGAACPTCTSCRHEQHVSEAELQTQAALQLRPLLCIWLLLPTAHGRAEPCSLPGTTSVPEPRSALPRTASGASRLWLPFKAAENFLTASPRTRDSHRKLHEGLRSKQTQIFINISENLNIGIFPHVCKHLAFLQKSGSTHVFLVHIRFQLTDCSSKTSATISIISKPRCSTGGYCCSTQPLLPTLRDTYIYK